MERNPLTGSRVVVLLPCTSGSAWNWERRLGSLSASLGNFCPAMVYRLPHSGVMWTARDLEPVGIAVTSLQASDSDKDKDKYVDQ
ncbi:hypothetical protein FOZ62_022455 [Perkinsus olseni]|uniref:Uncharacterized protein n=2 Tax=Perkinsus olseni TaxID=32597 RepID=A0A7J6RY48_PEROL|nr:hypothetical protein FOZ62_022455 [Perkinsus olseni]